MQTLFDLIYEFWWYWYTPGNMSQTMIDVTNWLIWGLTTFVLLGVFVVPFVFAIRKVRYRRKS